MINPYRNRSVKTREETVTFRNRGGRLDDKRFILRPHHYPSVTTIRDPRDRLQLSWLWCKGSVIRWLEFILNVDFPNSLLP